MIKFKVITKDGELSANFPENQFKIACDYADLNDGKVIDAKTRKVLRDFCKAKHFTDKTK